MGKIDFRNLADDELKSLDEELWDVLSRLHKKKELLHFLRAMITTSEVVMLARRIRIAKFLLAGANHLETSNKLSVGLTTVQAVDSWLRIDFKNYKKTLPPFYEKAKKEKKKSGRVPAYPETFTALRRRYPLHFLLFNLALDDL